MPTELQIDFTDAIINENVAQFNAADTTVATISQQNTAGAWGIVRTVSPVYLDQRDPSELAQALNVAEVLRTRWKVYALPEHEIAVGDRLTWDDDLVFLVTGLDLTILPGAVEGTLERVYTE